MKREKDLLFTVVADNTATILQRGGNVKIKFIWGKISPTIAFKDQLTLIFLFLYIVAIF